MGARYSIRQAFTVPAGAGTYAPERLTVGVVPSGMAESNYGGILGVSFTLEAPGIAASVAELWVAKVGATGIDADYTLVAAGITLSGFQNQFTSGGIPGFQIRVKSGGTGGSAFVSAQAT